MSDLLFKTANPAAETAEISAARSVPESLSDLLAQHGTNPNADSGQRIGHRPGILDRQTPVLLLHSLMGLGMACVVSMGSTQQDELTWGTALIYGALSGIAIQMLQKPSGGTSSLGLGLALGTTLLLALLYYSNALLYLSPFYVAVSMFTAGVALIAVVITITALVTGRLMMLARIAAPAAAVSATLIAA
jgi:hypothetical protein